MIRIGIIENIQYVVRWKKDRNMFVGQDPSYGPLDAAYKYQSGVAWTDAEDLDGEVLMFIGGKLYDLVEVQ